ncbi:aspartyl-phosphate phosphatase Spo0E family protein [Oceanobacillus sp. 1P07AA]
MQAIEDKRKEMIELALNQGFNSKKVIQISQELDELIYQNQLKGVYDNE